MNLFYENRRTILLALGVIFLVGLGVRLYRINTYPLQFYSVRQYRSALLARSFYQLSLPSIPDWEREVLQETLNNTETLEIPLLEKTLALVYRIYGGAELWIGRLLSSVLWLIGGWFLWCLARRNLSIEASIFCTSYFLLLPYGVKASRSIQPDPSAIMLILAGFLAAWIYFEKEKYGYLFVSMIISGLAVLLRPFLIFPFYCAILSVFIFHDQKAVKKKLQFCLLALILGLLPATGYYLFGLFVSGHLQSQASFTFCPQLLGTKAYWSGWLTMIGSTAGYIPFFSGIIAVFFCRPGPFRRFFVGLWLGYIVFGLTFTTHVATHSYYHLILIPICSLSIGVLIDSVLQKYNFILKRRLHQRTIASLFFSGVLLTAGIGGSSLHNRSQPELNRQKEFEVAELIGQTVNHSTKCILLTNDLTGGILQYHGLLWGKFWPSRANIGFLDWAGVRQDNTKERFEEFLNDQPEYFIITNLEEFNAQKELKQLLTSRFQLKTSHDSFLIFDLQSHL